MNYSNIDAVFEETRDPTRDFCTKFGPLNYFYKRRSTAFPIRNIFKQTLKIRAFIGNHMLEMFKNV